MTKRKCNKKLAGKVRAKPVEKNLDSIEFNGLTAKQKTFCHEYLVDLSATKAAIRAGYSPDTAGSIGSENLTKPEIKIYIEALMRERSRRTDITADRVLNELAKIAFSDPRAIFEWSPDGVRLRDSKDLTDDQAACVSEVSETQSEKTATVKVKLHDKLGALDKIARHLGMYSDKVTVSGDPDMPMAIEITRRIVGIDGNEIKD